MKKALHIIAFAAVAIAALTSCAKEEFKENAIPAGEKIEVSLNGQIGEFTPADATKATAESVVRVTWGEGDKVYVYDGSDASIGTLTITPDDNNASYAMLSGTITASAASPAPSKLTLVYVKGATEAPTIAGGKISVDLSSQNQAEVPFVLYTTVDYDAATLTKTNEYISFNFATSVMTVNCTGLQTGDSGAVTGIDRAEIDGVSTACELTIDGSGVTAVAGTTPGKITRTETAEPSVFTQSDSRGSFRLALAADPIAPAARNILVHQGSKVSGSPFTTATLAAGKSYNTVYQMCEYVATPAGVLPGGFTVNASGKKVHFSNGNLYAKKTGDNWTWNFYDEQYKYNSNPTSSGSRTATDTDTEIDLFTWGYDNTSTNNSYSLNPVNTAGISGHTTDGDKQFSASEDWGYVFGGESSVWRTLTSAEWQYLFNTRSNASNLYKYGVTVCSKANCVVLLPDNWDGTVISLTNFAAQNTYDESSTPKWSEMQAAGAVCLPAAGGRYNSTVYSVGEYGRYWSSTAHSDFGANYVNFGSSNVNPGTYDDRFRSCSVRLVTEASSGYAPAVKVTGVTLKSKTTIEVGDSETLVANVLPANAANKQINWLSSDTSVATVDATSGEVTGVAKGSANIFATTADGNFIAVCLVTVTPKPLPAGALKGEFSVSATKKVNFSQGNLTYNVSTSTWVFYEHQYDCATAYDANLISLFTWGYSASTSLNPTGVDYVTAHPDDGDKLVYDKASSEGGDDWGVAYCESNNITVGTWRTLSIAEWHYLFYTRTMTNEKSRYTLNITYSGKMGVVLYPDDYAGSELSGTVNSLPEGVVFLPAVGQRSFGSNVDAYFGSYWSSTSGGSDLEYAYRVYFASDYLGVGGSYNDYRGNGYSVRLVTE